MRVHRPARSDVRYPSPHVRGERVGRASGPGEGHMIAPPLQLDGIAL